MIDQSKLLEADAQRFFLLAFMAYLNDTTVLGSDERDQLRRLREALGNKDFQDHQGTWEVVWGPVQRRFKVGQLKLPTRNTFFVLYNAEEQQYVVSIAGTNPLSVFGWFVEDFEVAETVPWSVAHRVGLRNDPWKDFLTNTDGDAVDAKELAEVLEMLRSAAQAEEPAIALGTFVGLTKLEGSVPLTTIPPLGQELHLLEFLFGRMEEHHARGEDVRVTVCGHSLGGTLTPAVALWLHEHRPVWDPKQRAAVHAWSYAGATPGNVAFKERFNAAFDVDTDRPRAFRVYNELDVVPNAWAPELLDRIETLYAPVFRRSDFWRQSTEAALEAAAGRDTEYAHVGYPVKLRSHLPTWRRYFPLPSLPIPGISLGKHLTELIWQHTVAYFAGLEIELSPEVLKILVPWLANIPGAPLGLSKVLGFVKDQYEAGLDEHALDVDVSASRERTIRVA